MTNNMNSNGPEQLRQRIAELISVRQPSSQDTLTSKLLHHFSEIANRHNTMTPMLEEFVADINYICHCSAIGVRILDMDGNIPYEAYRGFSADFYEKESPLSINSDKCMCINVIKGETDSSLPFYTKFGSFYMNATTRFLATVSEEEKGQTRNECNAVGYETVALIPIRAVGGVLGLIHIADPHEDMAPLELVHLLEQLAMQLGSALSRAWAHEKLCEYRDHVEALVESRTNELVRTNELLQRENTEHKKARKAQDKLFMELKQAFANIKTLEGMLDICTVCKKIRGADGGWHQLESYISTHSKAHFSHGYCPECGEEWLKKCRETGGTPKD